MKLAKIFGILVALVLVGMYGFRLFNTIQQNKQLIQERNKESLFLQPLSELQQEKRKYQTLSIQVASNLYTPQRLFNLYKGFEKEFGSHFYSVKLNPSYTVDSNGMKWFYITIRVNNMKPEDFFAIVQKEIPPLFVDSFQVSKNSIIAVLKGMINTNDKGFVITSDLYKADRYIICKLVAVTNDPVMEKYLIKNGYYVAKKGNQYYAGKVLVKNLDSLTAQAIANKYSSNGMIVMIVKEGGK